MASPAAGNGRPILEFTGLTIETDSRRVYVDSNEVALTKTEFDLLVLLATRPGVLTTTEEILAQIWETDWAGDGHAIEVQMSRLRRKLKDSATKSRFISTVRGLGYRFDAEAREIVVITYDRELRITDVTPSDRAVLGWDPLDLLGRFKLLAAGPISELSQDNAVATMQAQARIGPHRYELQMSVMYADGSQQTRNVRFEILCDENGEFSGARTTVL